MRKIGILATIENHYEYVLTLVRLFAEDDTWIRLYVTSAIWQELMKEKEINEYCDVYLKDKNETVTDFLKKNVDNLNELDLLVSDEFYAFREIYKLSSILKRINCPKYLTLHSINIWLRPNYLTNAKNIAKHLIRRSILKKFDGMFVESNNINDYILKNCNYRNMIFVVPFSLYSPNMLSIKNEMSQEVLAITVPGNIEKSRRDYDKILGWYKNCVEANLRFRLVLLGRPIDDYGWSILDACEKANKNGAQIEYFKEFIPSKLFEKQIIDSSILLADIPPKLYRDGTEETYGRTKETGITWLGIKYAKPMILPKSFKNIPELDTSIIKYDNIDHLKEIFIDLTPEKIQLLTKQALLNSKNFTLESVKENSQIKEIT